LVIDTTLAMIEKHQNLPPGEKETFALTFKKMSDSLAKNQDQKLERLKAIPRRLPDAIVQPKVTFVPGRKRALTGREAAELQEKEEARLRRRAQIAAEKQEQTDARQEQATALHCQLVATVPAEYVWSKFCICGKRLSVSPSNRDRKLLKSTRRNHTSVARAIKR
jgi:hypothetical protein